MGNKSKRRQQVIVHVDSEGKTKVDYRDAGYGRITKSRCARAINTNTAADREEMNRLRREARRARKVMASEAEVSAHVLRGLISYHERMTMGNYPERDFYLEALRFALESVEEKVSKLDAV